MNQLAGTKVTKACKNTFVIRAGDLTEVRVGVAAARVADPAVVAGHPVAVTGADSRQLLGHKALRREGATVAPLEHAVALGWIAADDGGVRLHVESHPHLPAGQA